MITEQQREAIECEDKYILVKAGAGTGKTEVLTRRILHLLSRHPNLSIKEIAVITFTNKATENLQSRLKSYLYHQWKNSSSLADKQRMRYELEQLNECQISTIHKFCQSILDLAGPVHFDDFDYAPNFKISYSYLYQALENALELWLRQKESQQSEVYHEQIMPVHELRILLLDAYQMLRSKGISVNHALQLTNETLLLETGQSRYLKQELTELLELLHEQYHKLCSRNHALDPDHLLEYCFKMLHRKEDLRIQVQRRYRYIFVDEFQDTSAYQAQILKLICDGGPESPQLFVVGDSKQSIYQFRGADLTSYQHMENWISRKGKVLSLSTNFRSTGTLVYYINWLFKRLKEENPELQFQPEPLQARDELPHETISMTDAYTWLYSNRGKSQEKVVAEYVRDQLALGRSPKQFAILFRKNHPMTRFASALEEAGIPCQLIGAGNFYNQREIVDAHKVMKYLVHRRNPLAREEAQETIFFNHNPGLLDQFLAHIEDRMLFMTPAQMLESLYQSTKIREKLIGNSPQAVANIDKLKDIVRHLHSRENIQLHEVVRWLSAMIMSGKEEALADVPTNGDTDAVTLITIHKAKGLEFPVVILPCLDETLSDGVLNPPIVYDKSTGLEISYTPYYQSGGNSQIPSPNYNRAVQQYQKDLYSEELRTLYVALTRAEEHLVFVGDEDCKKSAVCYQNWLRT